MITPQGCKSWIGLGLFLDMDETNFKISSLGKGVGYQCMMIGFSTVGSGTVIMTNTDTGKHQLKGFIGSVLSAIND